MKIMKHQCIFNPRNKGLSLLYKQTNMEKQKMTLAEGLNAFKAALEALWLQYYTEQGLISQMPEFETSVGRKFIKIVPKRPGGHRTVWGFIETETGNIYKAAGWGTPAKHVRGNIYNENPVQGCGPYGPDYLK